MYSLYKGHLYRWGCIFQTWICQNFVWSLGSLLGVFGGILEALRRMFTFWSSILQGWNPKWHPNKSQINQNACPGVRKYKGTLIRKSLFRETSIYVASLIGIPLYRDTLCRCTSIWESPIWRWRWCVCTKRHKASGGGIHFPGVTSPAKLGQRDPPQAFTKQCDMYFCIAVPI